MEMKKQATGECAALYEVVTEIEALRNEFAAFFRRFLTRSLLILGAAPLLVEASHRFF